MDALLSNPTGRPISVLALMKMNGDAWWHYQLIIDWMALRAKCIFFHFTSLTSTSLSVNNANCTMHTNGLLNAHVLSIYLYLYRRLSDWMESIDSQTSFASDSFTSDGISLIQFLIALTDIDMDNDDDIPSVYHSFYILYCTCRCHPFPMPSIWISME